MALKYDKLLNDYDKHCQRIAKSTTIRINEIPAEKVRRMRHLEADYTRWFSYYFPNFAKKPCAWFHKRLANKVIENRHIRALAEWYRSAAKSVHIDMGIPLFLYLVKSDLHYMLLIGETEPKARKLLSSLQAQLQHNQRILNDYGQRFQYGDWADGDFTTVDGVKFTALGFMQSPRGAREDENRPDYIVIDDVDNKRHVKNLNDFTPEWPEKADAAYWRKKFNDIPYRSFMREFMHVHIQDGAVFRHEDIVWGQMLPLKEYDGLCFYGDLSYKAAGDYKAMLLVGKIGRQYHIIHVYLRRGSRAKCAAWLYDLYEDLKLERFNISYVIEGLFAMDEFVNDFDTEGDERGYHIPVTADKRGKADKYDRVESTAGFFERHNVIFNILMQQNPDFITLVDQFLAFERGSQANDDGPDAWHGAQARLNKITFVEKFQPRTVSRAERRSKSKNNY